MTCAPALSNGCFMDIGDHASPLLGQCYAEGKGVPNDNVTASMWLNIAAEWDHEKSKELLKSISLTMTPAEVLKAQQLGRDWMALHNQ
jgi:TPR repeat protein